MYGFGQLVSKSDEIVTFYKSQNISTSKKQPQSKSTKSVNNTIKNDTISYQNIPLKKGATPNIENIEYVDFPCPICGEDLTFEKDYVSSAKTLTCPLCENEFETKTLL